ncbi:response regulator [Variovorax sp. PBL-E5]|uniref:response regulator n=1 Tax=Variovorax sp. PBL-E5 TaxID=434014 RepID=UPI001316B99D|nr:response regulator transcription factor [Variovorax sp. PBL-E5]VTU32238.1 Protease production enhancer protein [Variovorax sp. PBL-E5]
MNAETALPRIRLVLVDDHALVRDGLCARLAVVPHLQVVGEAASGAEALQLAESLAPDLMLIDVGMRGMNGIELATALRARHPSIRVLMLSMYDNREYVQSAIRAGALGYVLKESPTEEILAAIGAVCVGGRYFSAQVSGLAAQSGSDVPQLTAREHEVLVLLAHGRSNKVVAKELDISVRTVETHRFSLRRKLGVDSAAELLKIAVTHGWTTL